jgi:hypothetical protein
MSKPPPEEPLVIVPIPAFVVLLSHLERQKGAPLTEAEVLAARDNAGAIALPLSQAKALADKRGYDDLDPARIWEDWQVARRDQGPEGDA